MLVRWVKGDKLECCLDIQQHKIAGASMVTKVIAEGLYVKNQKIAGANVGLVVSNALQFDINIVWAPNKWSKLLLAYHHSNHCHRIGSLSQAETQN